MTFLCKGQNLVPYAFVWEKAYLVDFSETIAVYDVKVGMNYKLNEYMKIRVCLKSRSYFDLGPRSLRFCHGQHFQRSSQKPLGQIQISCRFSLGWGNEIPHYYSHMTKVSAMPVYGKKL